MAGAGEEGDAAATGAGEDLTREEAMVAENKPSGRYECSRS